MKKLASMLGGIALAAASLFGGPASALADDLKTVRIGVTPYFDYIPWVIIHKLGIDHDLGVDLDIVNIDSTAKGVAAMKRGSLDVVSSCHVCDFPLYKAVPDLTSWLITDQFKGFIIIGRKGAPTYADLVANSTPDQAKETILEGFKGKEFPLVTASYSNTLGAALSQAKLTLNDVKITDMPDDAQAALAFEKGVGDYYMGSLPQETKLLASHDKYVDVGGQEILGDAGLWYSTMVSTKAWLAANDDTTEKLVAMWYRFSRYAAERFDTVAPEWVDETNSRAAAAFTLDQFKLNYKLLDFPTIASAQKGVYDPSSSVYWKRSVDYYAGVDRDQLDASADPDAHAQSQQYFDKLLRNKQLLDYVNSPLK